jgi:chromate transporter
MKWLSRKNGSNDQQFLDLLGATNLIPGPNSTEMAIHIGQERERLERTSGLHCSCSPINRIFCYGYKEYNYLIYNLLYGIKPAIIAVNSSYLSFGKKSLKTVLLGVIKGLTVTIANQRNCSVSCSLSSYSIQKRDHLFKIIDVVIHTFL